MLMLRMRCRRMIKLCHSRKSYNWFRWFHNSTYLFEEHISNESKRLVLGTITRKIGKKTYIVRERLQDCNIGHEEVLNKSQFHYLKKGFDTSIILSIAKQLGYIPITLVDVAYYHETDHRPIVLQLYPLNYTEMSIDRKSKTGEKERVKLPFPTLFWLSCPEAFSKIAKLEHDGWIPILQEKLLKDEEALLLMKGAHEEYAKERWDLLSEEDKAFVEGQSW